MNEGFVRPCAARRQRPPRPGEWRFVFPEEGQTFDEYVATCSNRRTPGRTVLYLQPLGDPAGRYGRLLALLREFLEAYFQIPVRTRESSPVAAGTLDSTRLLEALARRVPADALGLLGVTDRPLSARGMKFVFGESPLGGPAGVASLARLETPEVERFFLRACKLAAHEAGHLFSIRHCIFYECVMQGANTLAEADGHPLEPCAIDARKLQWNLGFDPERRLRALEGFFRRMGERIAPDRRALGGWRKDKKYGCGVPAEA